MWKSRRGNGSKKKQKRYRFSHYINVSHNCLLKIYAKLMKRKQRPEEEDKMSLRVCSLWPRRWQRHHKMETFCCQTIARHFYLFQFQSDFHYLGIRVNCNLDEKSISKLSRTPGPSQKHTCTQPGFAFEKGHARQEGPTVSGICNSCLQDWGAALCIENQYRIHGHEPAKYCFD